MNSLEPRWWAVLAVTVASLLLPPGPVRRRYRAELTAEQYGMTRHRQAAHAMSVMAGARALHDALVDSGELTVPHSPSWCRLHLHHRWHGLITPDGERFRRCTACGIDDDETSRRRVAGSMLSAHGVVQY
jgi:hypothetical protein